MNNVLIIWTDCNPSTIEKNHLILNGLKKSSVNVFALGFVHSKKFMKYFDSVFSSDVLYDYQYGIESELYKGSNFVTKIFNNIKIVANYSWWLFKYLRNKNCSIVIVPPQPFELTFPTYVICKIFGAKIIPNIMEYYPALPNYNNRKSILKRMSWNIIVKYSYSYIVISHFLKDKFSEYGKEIFVLPAILSESELSKINSSKSLVINNTIDGPVFLYTSSSAYEDLLEFSLNSLASIRDKEFRFVITGGYSDSQKNKWMNTINLLKLNGKVTFSGFLSDSDLLDLQLRSTALLIPLINNDRHRARFPQKVLGYMALGKPVVTTKVGEMADYFKDGDNVIMSNLDTPEDFSKKLMIFFDSPDISNEIGSRGCITVLEEFSERTWGRKLKTYLEKVEAISG